MDINIKPVVINSDNKKTYQMVAHLVDQQAFRKDLAQLKHFWKLHQSKNCPKSEYISVYIEPLLPKFKLGIQFKELIFSAISEHVISTNKSISTYPILIDNGEPAIVVSKDTTKEQLLAVFHQIKTEGEPDADTVRTIKNYRIPVYADINGKVKIPKTIDTYNNIKEHRKWYWMHQKITNGGDGLSYFKIGLNIYNNSPNPSDRANSEKDAIRKGVGAYKKFLQSDYIGSL